MAEKWEDSEDQIVRDLYPKLYEIKKKLITRTIGAIKLRARILNVPNRRKPLQGRLYPSWNTANKNYHAGQRVNQFKKLDLNKYKKENK